MQDPTVFFFDQFCLDVKRGQLRCGQEVLPLQGNNFAVLHYLVQHADQLLTQAEIQQAVWPNVHTEASAVKTCVGNIRRALGDQAKDPRFITTQRGKMTAGYRFIMPVTPEPGGPEGPESPCELLLDPTHTLKHEAAKSRLVQLKERMQSPIKTTTSDHTPCSTP